MNSGEELQVFDLVDCQVDRKDAAVFSLPLDLTIPADERNGSDDAGGSV
jgi:hypothetical protein